MGVNGGLWFSSGLCALYWFYTGFPKPECMEGAGCSSLCPDSGCLCPGAYRSYLRLVDKTYILEGQRTVVFSFFCSIAYPSTPSP